MKLDPINGKRLAPSFEKGDGTKENAYSIFDLDNLIMWMKLHRFTAINIISNLH
jgi:hypothetical protein